VGVWYFSGKQQVKQDLVAATIKPDTQEKRPEIRASKPAEYKHVAAAGQTADTAFNKNALAVPSTQRNGPAFEKKSQPFAGQAKDADAAMPAVADVAPASNNTMAAKATPNGRIDTSLFVRKPMIDTSRALNEVAVMKEAQVKNKDIAYKSTKTPSAAPETELPGKVPGVGYTTTIGKPLSGTVVSTSDGRPLIGAVVKVAGTKYGSVTDANGHFVLPDVPERTTITAGYLGYNTKKIKPGDKDSLKIALEPSSSSLSEVVVVGNSDKNDASNKPVTDAHPGAGWKALTDYLDKKAVLPDGQTGSVQLLFMVDGQGGLSKFKVLKSLSRAADQKAIDLIIKGPSWAGNIDGQPHEVKLTIKFH